MLTHVKDILTHVTHATQVKIWPSQPKHPRNPRNLAYSRIPRGYQGKPEKLKEFCLRPIVLIFFEYILIGISHGLSSLFDHFVVFFLIVGILIFIMQLLLYLHDL